MKNTIYIYIYMLSYQFMSFIRGGENVEYLREALFKEKKWCNLPNKKIPCLYNRDLGTLHEIRCQSKHCSKYMIYTQGFLCWKSTVICRGKNQTCHTNLLQHNSQSRETLEKCVYERETHCQDLLTVTLFICDFHCTFCFDRNFFINGCKLQSGFS